jgi:hypothetical protein
MSESARSPDSPAVIKANELDESTWRAWQLKNAEQDRRRAAARMVAVKYACLALLLVTTVLWESVGSYHIPIRFALAVGALAVAGQERRLRSHGFVLTFLAIAVIYNPIVAIFPISSGWPFPLVFLTSLAFTGALIRLKPEAGRAQPGKASIETRVAAWENEGGASVRLAPDLVGKDPKGARQ